MAIRHGIVDFTDGRLFGNDAGEDELPDVLNSYFVEQHAFAEFLNRANRFRITRSRKGMGKSALLSKLAYELEHDPAKPIVIRTTGAELVGIAPRPPGINALVLQNYWLRIVCARINYAIGSALDFTFSDTGMALVESAEIAGFRERNIIGSLLQRIKSSKIPIEIKTQNYGNHEELLKRAADSLGGREVWLLVDDIDSTFVDTDEENVFVSTFFSACRAIVRDVKGLSIRASVRTDVWTALRKNEDLDKCEQYVSDINWTIRELKATLARKIQAYLERDVVFDRHRLAEIQADADRTLELVFEAQMRFSGGLRPPFHAINAYSMGRPRWMSQLCRLAGIEAAKRGKKLIGIGEINLILGKYSRLRRDDIYKEHAHQFADLQRLVETFANGPQRYTTKELLALLGSGYVLKVGADAVPPIDGYRYRSPMQLGHFVYKVGFINARVEREDGSGSVEFVHYEERPELLLDIRNPDDGHIWEVHPSYREALNIGRQRTTAEEGRPGGRGHPSGGARRRR